MHETIIEITALDHAALKKRVRTNHLLLITFEIDLNVALH